MHLTLVLLKINHGYLRTHMDIISTIIIIIQMERIKVENTIGGKTDPGRLRKRNAELRKHLLGILDIANDTQNANTIFNIDVRIRNSRIAKAMDIIVEVTIG